VVLPFAYVPRLDRPAALTPPKTLAPESRAREQRRRRRAVARRISTQLKLAVARRRCEHAAMHYVRLHKRAPRLARRLAHRVELCRGRG